MALDKTGFQRPSESFNEAPAICSYVTPDTHANMVAANYFNGLASVLKKNDIIMAVGSSAGTQTLSALLVTANDGTTVTVKSNALTLA